MKHYISYFENEQECLKAILEIHNKGEPIECDPMYFKGNFYKNGVEKPRYRFDINPQVDDCENADATDIPLDDNSLKSIILDPPFLFGIHGQTSNYYSAQTHTIFQSLKTLENCYKGILQCAYKKLQPGGLLIFKCQDYTDRKDITMTHCLVWQWATETGFKTKDIAILKIPQSKIYNPNLSQRCFRKVHTYFWVFKKPLRQKH